MAAAACMQLAACSSAVTGHGTPVSGAATAPVSGGPSSRDFPSGVSAAPSAATSGSASAPAASASTSAGVQPSRTLTVTGTTTGTTYVAHVYASDTLSDCAAHAYGARMIAFLRAHPCRAAHRVLATIDDGGRAAVVSLIATSFGGTAADPYSGVAAFTKLEEADGTGSINDLLREGHHITGVASQIPAKEAFRVVGQDQGVTVFDAWWVSGPTPDQDHTLLALEEDLFLTPLQEA